MDFPDFMYSWCVWIFLSHAGFTSLISACGLLIFSSQPFCRPNFGHWFTTFSFKKTMKLGCTFGIHLYIFYYKSN